MKVVPGFLMIELLVAFTLFITLVWVTSGLLRHYLLVGVQMKQQAEALTLACNYHEDMRGRFNEKQSSLLFNLTDEPLALEKIWVRVPRFMLVQSSWERPLWHSVRVHGKNLGEQHHYVELVG